MSELCFEHVAGFGCVANELRVTKEHSNKDDQRAVRYVTRDLAGGVGCINRYSDIPSTSICSVLTCQAIVQALGIQH